MNRGEVPRRRKGRASLGMTTKTEAGGNGNRIGDAIRATSSRRCAPDLPGPYGPG